MYLQKVFIDLAQIKTCLNNIQLPGVLVKDSIAPLDLISQGEVKVAIASLNYQWTPENNVLGLINFFHVNICQQKEKIWNTEIIVLKISLMDFE